jgi:hypothetical protein
LADNATIRLPDRLLVSWRAEGESITSAWWPPFSWYPGGSVIKFSPYTPIYSRRWSKKLIPGIERDKQATFFDIKSISWQDLLDEIKRFKKIKSAPFDPTLIEPRKLEGSITHEEIIAEYWKAKPTYRDRLRVGSRVSLRRGKKRKHWQSREEYYFPSKSECASKERLHELAAIGPAYPLARTRIGCNWKTGPNLLPGFNLVPRVRMETMQRTINICGGDLLHDPIHSEDFRLVCGLVEKPPESAPTIDLKDFKPGFTLIRKNKPIIRRDYFGEQLPHRTAKELKGLLNPYDTPGPDYEPIECCLKPANGSHFPKKIYYTSKEDEQYWKDIESTSNSSRLYRYSISDMIKKIKDLHKWNDESPGEPEYHHITREYGKRMKRYIKLNKYTKSKINYKFKDKDKVMRQGDNTFGPDVWREVATVAAWRRVNNKTNKIKIPESTLGTFRGPIIETTIANCGYGLVHHIDENFLIRTKFTHSMCLDVNKWSIRPLRPNPEAVHADSNLLLTITVLKQLMKSMKVKMISDDPECFRCPFPPRPPKNYRKITGKYRYEYLGPLDEDFKKTRPITSDMEGEGWFVDANEQGNTVGGISPPLAPVQEDWDNTSHKPPNWRTGPFTHQKFLTRRYRRCIRSYIYQHPPMLIRRPREEQSKYLGEWTTISKCAPGKEAKADVCECKGCPHAFESSLYEREYDDQLLPPELSWSKACYGIFYHLPYVNPCQAASYVEKSEWLEQGVKPNLELIKSWNLLGGNVDTKWASSDKKVKEKSGDASWPGDPYTPRPEDAPWRKFKGTPIGELTEKAPDPGSRALHYLHFYARLGNDPKFIKSKLGDPTGENLKQFFIDRGIGEANAEKYLDLLVIYEGERRARQELKKQLRNLNKKKLKANWGAALKRKEIRAQICELNQTPKVLVKLDRYPDNIDPLYYVNRKCYQKDWGFNYLCFRLSHRLSHLELGEIISILERDELK